LLVVAPVHLSAADTVLRERSKRVTLEEPIKETVLRLIKQTAPEADVGDLNPDVRLRDQLDFDSVDFVNFALALQEAFRVEIPEVDFVELGTLNGCVRYLMTKGAAGPFPQP
jgi:acyl carrier protein